MYSRRRGQSGRRQAGATRRSLFQCQVARRPAGFSSTSSWTVYRLSGLILSTFCDYLLRNQLVQASVSLYHTALAEIEGAPPGALAKRSGQRRVVENEREGTCEDFRVARPERKAGSTQDFQKRADVRCHNGQGPKHIFSNNQAEDLSAERWADDGRCLAKCGIQFAVVEAACKAHMGLKLIVTDKLFERGALGALA